MVVTINLARHCLGRLELGVQKSLLKHVHGGERLFQCLTHLHCRRLLPEDGNHSDTHRGPDVLHGQAVILGVFLVIDRQRPVHHSTENIQSW